MSKNILNTLAILISVATSVAHFKRDEWMAFLTLTEQNLPIFVFNKNHQLVFSGSKADGKAQVLQKPFDGNFINYLKGDYTSSSDFIKIRLSRSIGNPLSLAERAPFPTEPVFTVGFPTGTGLYSTDTNPKHKDEMISRQPCPDSTGDRMLVSFGFCIDDYEGFNRSFRTNQAPAL